MLPKEGQRLRIYVGEGDRHEGMALYEWIVQQARQRNMAGATVVRGLEGFGAHSRMHTAKILRLSQDLPILIEIVDTSENIERFLAVIDEVIEEGIATLEPVHIHFYRGGTAESSDPHKP
jgi:PII-like signaling protein